MDAKPSSTQPGNPVTAASAAVDAAWPRTAQTAMAFLLGLAVALLAIHSYGYLRWGSRPTEVVSSAVSAYQIDLNRANRAELLQLPGVGDRLAERIVGYRRDHGSFQNVEELAQVEGIGPSTLERLQGWVYVAPLPRDAPEEPLPPLRLTRKPIAAKQQRQTNSEPKGLSKKTTRLTEKIDINRAGDSELQRLPGIGPKLAQRILQERSKRAFRSVEDLRRVRGIGPKTLERLRPYIVVQERPALKENAPIRERE